MKTLRTTLVVAVATTGLAMLAACDNSGGAPQEAEVKPVDPANQVTPGSANFSNPEERSN
jgi:hypothetical protein